MTNNYLKNEEVHENTLSDELQFNIIRSKHLTKAILDYVTEIQNANVKVSSSASDDIESENLIALAYTVNREIDKISALLSLLLDELDFMDLRDELNFMDFIQ